MSETLNVITPGSDRPAAPGYDHDLFAWSPAVTRPPLPDAIPRRLHLALILDLGAVEWEDAPERTREPRPVGGRSLYPIPDFPRMSHREFGHRVGIFHLLDMAEELGLAPAVAMDALTAQHYPALAETVRRRAAEIIAHGLSASRPITSALDRDQEREYITTALALLGGDPAPAGWLGPEYSATVNTLPLLAEAGLRYSCDWGNDDEPYATNVRGGSDDVLWMHPVHSDLADLQVQFNRKVMPWEYGNRIYQAAATLARDSAQRPRVLTLHLHAFISGQAHVFGSVREALRRVVADFSPVAVTPGQAVQAWSRPN